MTAVLMLVFKDPILGLVAGIQLSANRMLNIGDWLEMPKYGADGSVTDIGLTTVKVQNWDNTVTTLPTYALISDSFKLAPHERIWRTAHQAGGVYRQQQRAFFKRCRNSPICAKAACSPIISTRARLRYANSTKPTTLITRAIETAATSPIWALSALICSNIWKTTATSAKT